MNYLQMCIRKLMTDKGMTFREMERAVHGEISHVTWSRYEKGGTPTHGKQLAILAECFKCGVEDLLEPVTEYPLNQMIHGRHDDRPASADLIALEQECADLSLDEQLEARLYIRQLKRKRRLVDAG